MDWSDISFIYFTVVLFISVVLKNYGLHTFLLTNPDTASISQGNEILLEARRMHRAEVYETRLALVSLRRRRKAKFCHPKVCHWDIDFKLVSKEEKTQKET